MTKATDLSRHPLTRWNADLGLPDFAVVPDEEFGPVIEAAMEAHLNEIDAIATNPETPTIDNTLAALELAGEALSRATSVFYCKAGAHTNDTIQATERELAPKLSRHGSAIYQNAALFSRIDDLYQRRGYLGLDGETDRVLEKTWKRFVRAGAQLDAAQKDRLTEINGELAELGTRFSQNVLADERDWTLVLDETDLAGAPAFLRDIMAEAAAARGLEGRYVVTLSRSIAEPFLSFVERRDLREKVFHGFVSRGDNGAETGNAAIIARTLELRSEKARLLGYESYADLKLDDTMARTPAAVIGLLEPVWQRAVAKAAEDQKDLSRLAAADGRNDGIMAWDWRYYAEKLRAERYAFDEAELKPYLALENVIAACFDVAGRLFGLSFAERPKLSGWHEDVRVFEVFDRDGSHRAVFLADYFNRPSKRSGAWMSSLRSGYRLGGRQTPIVYNVMNFAKPAKGQEALLSLDEARTLFHEFGHALHGMLSDVIWPSVSGTAVARDFVELPSQLYEHWLTVPEILEKHARHVVTGQPIPKELIDKMEAARTYGAGFATVEFAASALMDMAYHARPDAPEQPLDFEAETMARLEKPDAIAMRHRSPHFLHVFSGDGYSAGYYSYLWSEVLDADAFAAFEEAGDPFDAILADKLRKHIYEVGGSVDPEAAYTAFRGRMPTPEPMMEQRGLA
ncbi:MAG: M3 family metallopeptidase [Rhizobiaceae bacterium]|nr:M3 family metallopeptidase [Rhizobiaceae bacterium]MCV0404600.1 M3 family metallopeptidase [Rhizobiaceae bacterium]